MGNNQAQLKVDITKLPEISQAIHSGDPKQELIGCQMAVVLLEANGPNAPPLDSTIVSVAESGILPKCMELLKDSNPEIQCHVADIISSMAYGNLALQNRLIEMGALDSLVQLLHSDSSQLQENAALALGNMGVDCYTSVIESGAVPHLASLAMSPKSPAPLLCRIARTFHNLSYSKEPPLDTVRQMLPPLTRLINHDEIKVMAEACEMVWSLTFWQSKLREVLNSPGLTRRLVQLLDFPEKTIVVPCLKAIGIMFQAYQYNDLVLNAGPTIQVLGLLMESKEPSIAKEACCAVLKLSNSLFANFLSNTLIISGGLVPVLIRVVRSGANELKGEAIRVINNIANDWITPQDNIAYLCESGAIPAICSVLKCKDKRHLLQEALDLLNTFLRSAEGDNDKAQVYRKQVVECDGLDYLDELQDDHEDSEGLGDGSTIYRTTCALVDKYFKDYDMDVKPAKLQKMDN